MVTEHPEGLAMIRPKLDDQALSNELSNPTDNRLFAVIEAFRRGWSLKQVHELTLINEWFLYHTERIVQKELDLANVARLTQSQGTDRARFVFESCRNFSEDYWRQLKILGFGDEQIAAILLRACFEEVSGSEIRKSSIEIRKLELNLVFARLLKKLIQQLENTHLRLTIFICPTEGCSTMSFQKITEFFPL